MIVFKGAGTAILSSLLYLFLYDCPSLGVVINSWLFSCTPGKPVKVSLYEKNKAHEDNPEIGRGIVKGDVQSKMFKGFACVVEQFVPNPKYEKLYPNGTYEFPKRKLTEIKDRDCFSCTGRNVKND